MSVSVDGELLPGGKGTANGASARRGLSTPGQHRQRRVLFRSAPRFRRLHRSGVDLVVSQGVVQPVRRHGGLRFCVDELNGLDILQYFVWKHLNAKSPAVQLCGGGLHRLHGLRLPHQGEIAKRSRCRGLTLQCFTSMPSYKVCTVSISDFLYLAEVGNAGWLHRSIWHPRRTIPIISAFSPRSTPHATGTSVGTSSLRCLLFCSL